MTLITFVTTALPIALIATGCHPCDIGVKENDSTDVTIQKTMKTVIVGKW